MEHFKNSSDISYVLYPWMAISCRRRELVLPADICFPRFCAAPFSCGAYCCSIF